jgi:hypothetical protein
MIIPQNKFVLIRKNIEPEEVSGILIASRPKAVEAEVLASDAEEVKEGDIVLVFASTGADIDDELTLINIEEILAWMKNTADTEA